MATAALHVVAVPFLVLVPSQWPAVLAALAGSHLGVGAGVLLPRSRLLGPNLTRLPAGTRRVALTFDDGPDPEITPAVLDLLEAHGARASFFCVARRAEEHPELAREIHERGHQVENHSYRHSHAFAFLGPAGLRMEIVRAQSTLERVVGRRPALFRAPAGIRSVWLDAVLTRLGLRLVSWTRRGFDTVSHDAPRIAGRLTRRLADGDIVLLHDGAPARDARGRSVVLSVLPRLLQELEAKGLGTIPVHEALRSSRT